MGLLKIKRVSSIVRNLEVAPGFEVAVRRLGPDQQAELQAKITKEKPNQMGQVQRVVDAALVLQHAPDFFIVGWEGLSRLAYCHLGIELEDSDEVPTEYTPALARELWEHARADRFSEAIMLFSTNMLALEEAAKKNALKISEGTSEA